MQAYQRIAKEMLLDGGRKELIMRVQGDSMAPSLRSGDTIVIQDFHSDQVRKGDILLVARKDDYVTHRLIHVSSKGFVLKGDNTPVADAPVSREKILGRVIEIRKARRGIDVTSPRRMMFNHWIASASAIEARVYEHFSRGYHPQSRVGKRVTRLFLRLISLPHYIMRYLIRL